MEQFGMMNAGVIRIKISVENQMAQNTPTFFSENFWCTFRVIISPSEAALFLQLEPSGWSWGGILCALNGAF